MRLSISDKQDTKLAKLLDKASVRLSAEPGLLRPLPDGTLEMSCPLPDKYKPSMNPWATEMCARINEHGWLFEISERSRGVSGGWGASCIPPPLYRTFLAAWLAQASAPPPLPLGQLELFAL
ncbi:MAG: hypothetical protein LBE51_08975 [Acidovorax sp.]|jgi:hypothetical protein|nr:hypothetical protein [Acidovorax sp.]